MWNLILFVLVVLSIVITSSLVVGIYNSLVKLKKRVENAWYHINIELKRKAILTDDLVENIAGYLEHEIDILEELKEASYRLMEAETVPQNAEFNHKLNMVMDDLFYIMEDYPELKIDANFEKTKRKLELSEFIIAEYQEFYNDLVYLYNHKFQVFSNNLVAKYFGLKPYEFFIEEIEANNIPNMDLSRVNEE